MQGWEILPDSHFPPSIESDSTVNGKSKRSDATGTNPVEKPAELNRDQPTAGSGILQLLEMFTSAAVES